MIARRVIGDVRPNSIVISVTISRNNVFRARSHAAARSGPICRGCNILRCTIPGVPNTITHATAVTLAGIALPCTLRVTSRKTIRTTEGGPAVLAKFGIRGNELAGGSITRSINTICAPVRALL